MINKVSSTSVRTILPKKDKDGRTQFIDEITRGSKVTTRKGVFLDSEQDFQNVLKMNKLLQEDRADFHRKAAASEASAAEVWLD